MEYLQAGISTREKLLKMDTDTVNVLFFAYLLVGNGKKYEKLEQFVGGFGEVCKNGDERRL